MRYPPLLKEGDSIGITAPSRKITPSQLEGALNIISSWGLNAILPDNIFSSAHGYLSGTDEERASDFISLINNPAVKAIFCARGGYGSTRIVEDLPFQHLEREPKWIVGFSDVTAIHLKLLKHNIPSIHGTMPIFFGRPESFDSIESIREILFSGKCEVKAEAVSSNREGKAGGRVIGGNLSLILDSLNTPGEPDTTGAILVIEEVDEYYYKLDRMMTQLRRAGKLKDLAGLIVGHLTDLKNSELDFGESDAEIILHSVRDYAYPVAFNFPTGHHEPNLAWIHGVSGSLTVADSGVILSYPKIKTPNE